MGDPSSDVASAAAERTAKPPGRRGSWAPLRRHLFRSLWIASLASNLGTWLQGVAAAWLMTTLTPSVLLVALVQSAQSLPMFLLSLPAGALADILDRRRLLIVTQSWMLFVAAALALLTATGRITPSGLLLFTFLLGLGAALTQPAWQAIIPELVPGEDLPAAIALGSVNFNIARAAGPALGGLLVAGLGPAANFLLNAASFLGVIVVLYGWKRPGVEGVLPAERFFGALSTGLRSVRHAPEVLAPIARGGAFVLCGSALWALLPAIARDELGLGPTGYGLLLAAIGLGAVAGAAVLPRLKRRSTTDLVVAAAVLVFAGATVALALVRSFGLLCSALLLAGGAWLSILSSLNVAIQTVVPGWVRARALSAYMLVFFAGLAGGSSLWGLIAARAGTRAALLGAAGGTVLGLAATFRYRLVSGEGLNLAPSRQWPAPLVGHDLDYDRGPLLVTVEYRVPPEDREAFTTAMADVRRIRLRDGALEWGLFADAASPDRFVELFLVKSWLEHLRQHERATAADREAKDAARRFHAAGAPPEVRHWVAERVARRRLRDAPG